MALKRNENGTFTIMNEKDLEQASTLFAELDAEIKRITEEYELTEMQSDVLELQRAAADYAARKRRPDIEFGGREWAVVQRHTRSWNGEKLRKLVKDKAIWLRITKQTPDPDAIDEAISEGVLHENDISEAYEEKPQRPYLKLRTGTARNDDEEKALAAIKPQRKGGRK